MTWLAIVGVLSSVLSGYYYLRILFVFWMSSPEEGLQEKSFPVSKASAGVLMVCAGILLVIGWIPYVRDISRVFFF